MPNPTPDPPLTFTDPATLERLTTTLRTAGGATPAGAGYWEAIAAAAVTELIRTIKVVSVPIPDQRFLIASATEDRMSQELRIAVWAARKTKSEAMTEAEDGARRIGRGTVAVLEMVALMEAQG